ncbi:MAG: Outer membrane protein assembly factor BamB [Verrucomicrobia subdivision 3 bacterium]|nr:Outer membrane protein assembly factor BamB [Limisphaerales bacterium]MCS1414053.1 Outer membrane protein assembly factor BamB [Limisphaerales bacterium]
MTLGMDTNNLEQMDNKSPRTYRFWIPALIISAYIGLVFWARASEHMMGAGLVFLGNILGVFLLWIWWTFLSGLRGWGKWVSLLSAVFVVGFLSTSIRYAGSSDGSGMPRFVWKWSPTPDQRLLGALPQPNAANVPEAPLRYLAADSPEYYGPNRNGVFNNLSIQVGALGDSLEELWHQPIGMGWSSFAVVGRIAVTQEQRGGEEWVTAYALESGSRLWHYAKTRRFSEAMGGDGPRATPSIHNNTVYALGATGILDALNLTNGAPQWSFNVLASGDPNLMWGKSASPLFLEPENTVIVTGGAAQGPTVQALHADTGEVVWSWGNEASSYASPIEATIQGERQLVVVNENTVVGLSPDAGKPLWVFDWPVGMMQPSAKVGQPTVIDGSKVLITASYGIGAVLFKLTRDNSGKLTPSQLWHSKNRLKTKFSTACVRGNYAYGLDEGIFACLNLTNGKRLWKDGRYGFGQNLLVDDTLLIQAENGDIALVAADPKAFRELARFPAIDGKTWNVPTLAGEYLLVRNDREAACYRLPVVANPTK